ncbi:MAG: amino acid permease [Ruminococcaceae bacterium]|nr:amino acid permease [Oscillospiraceae bacterium]
MEKTSQSIKAPESNIRAQNQLKRVLPTSVAVAIGIGTAVGSGIFTTVGEVAAASGCALFVMLSFLIGGLKQIPEALFYAEVSTAYPQNGASYRYFERANWRYIAFLSGMTNFLGTDPPGIAIIAIAFARYVSYFLGAGDLVNKFIAIAAILAFMFIYVRSSEGGGKVLNVITTFKIIPFVILTLVGLAFINPSFITAGPAPGAPTGILALIAGVSATSWSYDGVTNAVCITGELKDPKKMPFALVTSVLSVTILYTLFGGVVSGLLPFDKLTTSDTPVADAFTNISFIGKAAGSVTAAIGIVVILGCLGSCIFAQPRLQHAMANDGLWFQQFGKIHPKYGTPAFSIIVQCLIACVFVFFLDFADLLGYFSFVLNIRSIAGYLVIFKYRKQKNYRPTYRMPVWWLITGFLVVMAAIMLYGTLQWAPVASLIALGIAIVLSLIGFTYFNKKYGHLYEYQEELPVEEE